MSISESQVERTISKSVGVTKPGTSRGRAGIDDGLMGVALLAGPANVIMQLARPGVGYGVLESRVDSGRVDLHPIKRARTTFTYLAVAAQGTPEQRAAYRRAVNGAHAQVYSTDESPVSYNAFDPDLQMWVGACMYKGVIDVYELFVGEIDDAVAQQLWHEGIALGTMLQVPREKWPADQAAFDRYWNESVEKVHIDDAVRDFLWPIAAGRVRGVKLPSVLQRKVDDFNLLITGGFLPQRFRDEMRLDWDDDRQRRFDRLIKRLRTVNNVLPPMLQEFPFNWMLKDLDWRIRTGRPLV
jgi:uncharacterized protein (DUF2236 family)